MNIIIVNGNTIDWEEGMTVRRVLVKMNYTFRMIIVRVNGALIRKEDYDSAPVPPGASVSVYHLISGG